MDSAELFRQSSRLFPGGVNSPVRYYKPNPVFITRASGSSLWDVEGRKYVDYSLGFGAMILGHANREVVQALQKRVENGYLFGAPTEDEIRLARTITTASRTIRKIRFTNSGTEATMHAIRLARAYTKRKKIIKMEGCFHGAHDYALIKSGSGALTFGVPSSPGIPDEVSRTVAIADYNDLDSVSRSFKQNRGEIAALIVEPIMGNIGVVKPADGFLKGLRELATENDALLILDEIITGFRFGFSPYQDIARVEADLTTLGKIIGGGAPVGAFGGRGDIMDMISPEGPVYQSGTFSGNPFTMTSGYSTLDQLRKSSYQNLSRMTAKLVEGLRSIMQTLNINGAINSIGSMYQVFFNIKSAENYREVMSADIRLFKKYFDQMLSKGIFLPPSTFETNFMSFAHSENDVELTIAKMEESLKSCKI
ncbi:MAG: glutamate-1-semialdehyde 2,1-aminomutase [Thermoplasmataceae archaeon]